MERVPTQPPLALRLEELQRVGRLQAPPFAAVPPSCQAPIEGLVDLAGELKSAVLLGFTRDGCHLVSYTTQPVSAADGAEGYALQLWSYQQGLRCRRLWSVPLFRTQPYLDSLEDEDEFMAADDMLITVAEAPDSSLLVVHGRSADPTLSRDQHLPNFVTLIPGPLHAGAAQLQAVHLSYHTSYPHAPFNPFHFLTPLEEGASSLLASSSSSSRGGDGSPLAVALYTGDGVRFVHALASRQAPPPAVPPTAAAPSSSPGGNESDSSTSRFPSPEPAPLPAPAAQLAGLALAVPAGQRTPVQPPSSPHGDQQQAQQGQQGHQGHQAPQQQQARSSASPARSPSPHSSPWHRQGRARRPWQRWAAPASASPGAPGDAAECVLGARAEVTPCAHACSGRAGNMHGSSASTAGSSGGCRATAGVRFALAPQQLDLEACLFDALRQRGLPPAALVDYAAAPVQGATWQEQDGLLLLAVLRLTRQDAGGSGTAGAAGTGGVPPPAAERRPGGVQAQPQHRSACVLLHAAAADGSARMVEWLEPLYPWHDDLSAFLVQQTAFAGLAFEKAPAFFADFLARRYGSTVLPPRCRLPLVLTNRSVLGSGASLPHIVHPWLPQAILGYGSRPSV